MKLKFDNFTKCLLLLMVAMGMSSLAMAQRTISGTVTDSQTGETLIGANILVVGTSVGTITDLDGTYSIEVPADASELEFTYTGYGAQRMAIGASNVMDVQLTAGSLLEEIVVVGYGTQKSKEITSAISSVKAEDFQKGQVNNPLQLIQGKVAGLAISQPGSDPNGSPTIRLRGLSTVGANSSPLVVIDGVIGASLETVDPNDIESIDVLKDGSASAIYGSRASSGVILITTKRGQSGKGTVEYNGYVTAEAIARQVQVTDADEWRDIRTTTFARFGNGTLADVDFGQNTDWMDEVTRTAVSHVHNLSLSGGSGRTTYRAAFNYRDIQGIGINTGFAQVNGRLNLSQKALDDRLTVGLNISLTERNSDFGFSEAFRYATLYNPTAPVRWSTIQGSPKHSPDLDAKYDGYFQQENFDYFNPVAIAEQGINEGTRTNLLVNLRGDYELIDGLTASVSYSQERTSGLFGQFYPSNAYFRGFNDKGLASRETDDQKIQLLETTGNYTTDFGNNRISILGGYSYNEILGEGFRASAKRFITNDLDYHNLNFGQKAAEGDPDAVWSFKNLYKVIGFFGRVNLDINDTYYFMASLRREGSTRFGGDNRWGTFPAVSAGVDLVKLADIGADQLKLRLAYGVTGSLPPDSYLSQFLYTRQGNFFFNGGFVPAIGPARNSNPDLKWEEKNEFNAGLDFALMDYRLSGSIDFYNRTTEDLIFFVTVPQPPNFAGNTWANLEDVELQSSGVELSIGYNYSQGSNFGWEPRLTFATFRTTLETVDAPDAKFKFFQGDEPVTFDFSTSPGAPGQNNDPTIGVFGGERIGQIVAPVYIGPGADGDWQFKDVDDDGTLEIGIGEDDRIVVGNGLPDFSLGLQNTFHYGDFDFSFFLRGDFGHDLVNMYRNFYESLGNASSRPIENQVKTDKFDPNLFGQPKFSSYAVEGASFVTLDNVTLGYKLSLPDQRSLRVYVTGRNLFYITNYTGVDPNVRYVDFGGSDNGGTTGTTPNLLAPGLDRRNTYFRSYSVSFGVSLTL